MQLYRRWKKIILIGFGTVAVLALFVATVLPVLVRNKAVEVLREATPGISALVNGVSLSLTVKLKPFNKEPESSVHIALQKLSLSELAA